MSMSISWGTQYPKLKANLRLAVGRLKMLEKKKTEMAVKARPEVAAYISAHKEDRARVRVEHIIRQDYLVEAYEMLEMYCDLLLARFGMIEQMKTPDESIAEAVASLLWAAPRIACDVAEFKTISDQLTIKYGRPFAESARANQLDPPTKVNPRLIQRFSVTTPPKMLVEKYMLLIAQSAGVKYSPDPDVVDKDDVDLIDPKDDTQNGPVQVPYGWNTEHVGNMRPLLQPNPPPLSLPQEPQATFCLPQIGMPKPPTQDLRPVEEPKGAAKATSGDALDYDDLMARFENLKKRV